MKIYYTPKAGLFIDPRLYSTVRVSLVDIDTKEVLESLYDEAGEYEKCIASKMAEFQTDLYPTNNLMDYFKLPDNAAAENRIMQKIRSACPTVCAVGKTLYAVLELELTGDLTDEELHIFADQIRSQYEYGWGAEFELQNILTGTGEAVCLRLFHNNIEFYTASAFKDLFSNKQSLSKTNLSKGRNLMHGKMKSVHGIYKKHGREQFLEAAEVYSDAVNPFSIDKTIDAMESRWYDSGHTMTEATKMVTDYNNGLTMLNEQYAACENTEQIMSM